MKKEAKIVKLVDMCQSVDFFFSLQTFAHLTRYNIKLNMILLIDYLYWQFVHPSTSREMIIS